MRRFITLLVTIVIVHTCTAQLDKQYVFTETNGTYTPLSGGTPYWPSGPAVNVVPLPFSFTYAGTAYSSFSLQNYYGSIPVGCIVLGPDPYNGAAMIAANSYLSDEYTIFTKTEGTAPNRVFIIETNAIVSLNDQCSPTTSHNSSQIRLYETSNKIELVYGLFRMGSASDKPLCGAYDIKTLIGLKNGTDTLKVTTTKKYGWDNAALQAGDSYFNILCKPSPGKTFSFTPNTAYTCANDPVTVTGGTATVIDNYVDQYALVTMQVNGSSNSTALSYQWQQSADNSVWTDISGATKYYLTRQVSSTGWYRRKVTCEGNSASFYSQPVKITIKPFYESYCIPTYPAATSTSTDNYTITRVAIDGTTLNSEQVSYQGNSYYSQPYQRFPQSGSTTADVNRGVAYKYKIRGVAFNVGWVWLDINRNGVFEATEKLRDIPLFPSPGRTDSFYFTIPAATDTGLTCLRVRTLTSGHAGPQNGCSALDGWGETEDYIIRITAGACTSAPAGGTAVTNKSNVCGAENFVLRVNGAGGQAGTSFQWQSSPDSLVWNDIAAAVADTLSTTQAATHWYRRKISCSSYSNFSEAVKVSTIVLQGGMANTTASSYNCGFSEYTLSVTGGSTGDYQWQSSPDSSAWTNINGAVAATHNASAMATTYYRRQVSCTGGSTVYSSGVKVTVTAPIGGTTLAADSVSCAGNVSVSVSGASYNPGISFQWQSSADGSSWTNISNQQNETLNTFINTATWFRRRTGCGSMEAFSSAKKINIKAPLAGQASANPATVTCGSPVTLNASINLADVAYQWQQSADSISWNDISGAVDTSLIITPSAPAFYRRTATCSGVSAASVPVKVMLDPMEGGTTQGPTGPYECPDGPYPYSVAGGSAGTYQWQQSADGLAWVNITGAVNPDFEAYPSGTTWYRRMVKCAGADSAFSTPVKLEISGPAGGITETSDTIFQCGNSPLLLSVVQGSGGVSSVIFTWQVSKDNATWLNMNSPTVHDPYTGVSPDTTSYYRRKTSCGGADAFSVPVKIRVVSEPNTSITVKGSGRSCPGSDFTVAVINAGDTTGAVYQWQQSADGSTWNNITGATASILTTTQSAATWYRRSIVKPCGSQQTYSAPVQVAMEPFYNCYCYAIQETGCTDAAIVNVKLNETAGSNAIVNPTGCNIAPSGSGYYIPRNAYIIFNPGPFRTSTLQRGETYNAEVTAQTGLSLATAPAEQADIYIDFNHNGVFDADEKFSKRSIRTSTTAASLLGMEIRIPAGAQPGLTGMRVRYHADTLNKASCDTLNYGETEDYTITIDNNTPPGISEGQPYNTCISGTSLVISNAHNNTTTWQKLYDSNGDVIAELNAHGNQLDTVKTTLYVNNGDERQDLNGRFYLDRSVTIKPGTQPSTPVSVHLYFTQEELDRLKAVDAQAGTGNLNITKVSADCPAEPNSNNTFINTSGVSAYLGDYYLQFDVNSFSTFFLHSGKAQTSVLGDWRVSPDGYRNRLYWSAATERGCNRFEVERSLDGINFTPIGTVHSQSTNGNSTITLNYSFDDANAPGIVIYYRLRIYDNSGNSSYSAILKVKGNAIPQLSFEKLRPNPATAYTEMIIVSPDVAHMDIVITGINGQKVQESRVALVRGENRIRLNISSLAPGLYFIKGLCEKGCDRMIQKLVKQ